MYACPGFTSQAQADGRHTFTLKGERPASGSIDRGSQVILGVDERIRITNTASYPWRTIAYLDLYDSTGALSGSCTGTFIGPDVLLTAAHCLYDYDKGTGWGSGISVVPGKSGTVEPFGAQFAANAWVRPEWKSSGSNRYDYGIIKMPSSVIGNPTAAIRFSVTAAEIGRNAVRTKSRCRSKLNQSFSEKKGGNVTVQMTWTQMPGIWTQLRGAYTAGSGIPDVHWFGRDQFEWIKAGWIADMSEGINWANVEPWAKKAFEYPGVGGKSGVFAVTEHASTGELLYNKAMFKDLGITVPARGQFTVEEFKVIVKKIADSGKTPLANAIGDRNYPGTFMSNYALMAKLGSEDLVKLWQGEISWKDQRVLEALTFHEDLVKAKAYPTTFSSMTLSESHNYFHTQRKAAMFAVPSWYTARAFVPEDKGGQPKDFQLGFLSYPSFTDGKGKDTRFLDVGGAQTASAKTKNIDLAKELLNGYTNSDFANEWASLTALRTATKTDPSKIKALFPDYWKDYYTSHDSVNAVAGVDTGSNMKPGVLEGYTNVLNSGLPGGLLTAVQAAEKMDEVRLKNK